MYHHHPRVPDTPQPGDAEDAFYLYCRTEPVVIIYGTGRRLHANEDNSARRIMKLLDQLGREGIPIRGVLREGCVLDHSSLRALNCYLRHSPGLAAFKRTHRNYQPFHRYGWYHFEVQLGLRWVRHV